MIPAPKKYPVFIQMAPGTFSTVSLFTFPYYTSRSCQIIEPQLNRGSIRSPVQRSFVPIYFKKSTRYHLSHFSSGEAASSCRRPLQRHESLEHLPTHPLVSLRGCTHPKQSPQKTVSTPFPAPPRIPPPHTKHHHIFKSMTWSSSNQNGLVPRFFSKTSQIKLSHLALISPTKNGLKPGSNRVSNAFFTKGFYSNRGSNARFKRENLFEPLFASRTPRGRYFGSADLRLLTFDYDPFPIPSI